MSKWLVYILGTIIAGIVVWCITELILPNYIESELSDPPIELEEGTEEADSVENNNELIWLENNVRLQKDFEYALAFDEDIDVPSRIKIDVWSEFINNHRDNEYNTASNIHLLKANERLKFWQLQLFVPDEESDMILVEGGWFDMGNNENDHAKPVHRVWVDYFLIDKTEVTEGQYKEFCDVTGHNHPYRLQENSNYPVSCVTWKNAFEYAKWVGKRLPTEAEWEFAARERGRNLKWPGTNDSTVFNNYVVANIPMEFDIELSVVGTKRPNSLGLYDMCGNVAEWCSDWFDPNYYSNSTIRNPKGPIAQLRGYNSEGREFGYGHVLRGGCFINQFLNSDCYSRSWYSDDDPFPANGKFGFRCANSWK